MDDLGKPGKPFVPPISSDEIQNRTASDASLVKAIISSGQNADAAPETQRNEHRQVATPVPEPDMTTLRTDPSEMAALRDELMAAARRQDSKAHALTCMARDLDDHMQGILPGDVVVSNLIDFLK